MSLDNSRPQGKRTQALQLMRFGNYRIVITLTFAVEKSLFFNVLECVKNDK